MKYCNKCGKENPDLKAFCIHCGASLPLADKKTCNVCGTELRNGKCPKCSDDKETKSLITTLIGVIGTLTALLVIGFSSIEQKALVGEYNWNGSQKYISFVPSNMLIIICIVLLASTIALAFRINTVEKPYRNRHYLLIALQVVAGLFIYNYFAG